VVEVALSDEARRAVAAEGRRAVEHLSFRPDPDRRLEHQARLLLERHAGEQVGDPLLQGTSRILVRVEFPVAVEVAHAPAIHFERHRLRSHSGADHTIHDGMVPSTRYAP